MVFPKITTQINVDIPARYVDADTHIFKQDIWAEEARQAAKEVDRWFCFKRKKKLEKLLQLIRVGSACYVHGKVEDRDKLGQVLNEVEDVARRHL